MASLVPRRLVDFVKERRRISLLKREEHEKMKQMEVLVSHAQEETPVKSDTQKSTRKTKNDL